MKKLLFFSILGIILFVAYSGAQKNVFEDGAVGQGVNKFFLNNDRFIRKTT